MSIFENTNMKDEQAKDLKTRLDSIITLAYEAVCNKIAHGLIIVDNEASFQLQLGALLKDIGEIYVYNSNEHFNIMLEHTFLLEEETRKCPTKKARCDVFIELYNGDKEEAKKLGDDHYIAAIIELKYFKKENLREPNNRYDFFADLENLEQYKRQGKSQLNYMIVGTDHAHYFDENADPLSKATADFNFRENTKYVAQTELQYKTENPYGEPIILTYDYIFKWNIFSDKLAFMKLDIV